MINDCSKGASLIEVTFALTLFSTLSCALFTQQLNTALALKKMKKEADQLTEFIHVQEQKLLYQFK